MRKSGAGLATAMVALGACAILGLGAHPALAEPSADPGAKSVEDLKNLSLEQLADVEITSVSKRPESLIQAPAAIYVITSGDIRRSGVTSLPEALRLAPNLEVARLNASEYAISARGFNSIEASNKLLVLIDGRSVYSPVGSQVYWDQVNVMLADVDRIEVIRGPGGTLYGANAFSGVINVITKSAADTQGPLIDAGGGDFERDANVRLGGKLGDAATFRVYASSFDRDGLPKFAGDTTNDAYRGTQGGFRLDAGVGADAYTLQGDVYRNDMAGGGVNGVTEVQGGNLLGRWTRQFSNDSSASVQAYYDHTERTGAGQSDFLRTYDLQGQDNFSLGGRQQIVWGGEYRLWAEDFTTPGPFFFPRPRATLGLGNVFAQDTVALRTDLKLTLGLKLEDNNFSGLDWLPSARLAWLPDDHSLVWAAVSRAVRTPNRIERELTLQGVLAPSPDFASEKLWAYEIGYRVQPSPRATLSVSTYYNVYDDLRTDGLTNLALPIVLQNGMRGRGYGVEVWGEYRLTSWWRLKGGVNAQHRDLSVKPGLIDISALQAAGFDPAYQAQLRSSMNLSPTVEFDATVRDVDRTKGPALGVDAPGYIEADARLGWRVTPRWEVALDGYNLLNPHHLELNDTSTAPLRTVPRMVFLSLRLGF
jgi:iron complex outermembrane receptor protein